LRHPLFGPTFSLYLVIALLLALAAE